VASEEIGRVETHFDSLDDELSSGLRQGMRTKTSVEPHTLDVSYVCEPQKQKAYSPPSSIGLVVLELSREEDSNQDLEDTSLDSDDCDDTEDSVGCTPSFEVPEQFKECNHTNDGGKVSHGSHGSAEGVGVRVELI
jgi:hypothetical protein